MAAGGPGDHPLTDVLRYNFEVYNKECDDLIREISKYISIDDLFQSFEWFDNFKTEQIQLDEFKIKLLEKLNLLKNKAIENGWEIK